MGLSLHWEWLAPNDLAPEAARTLVHALRQAACDCGFAEVSEVVEATADRHATDDAEAIDRAWALSTGMVTLATPPSLTGLPEVGPNLRIPPAVVWAFRGSSPGAEDAAFGLAAYPPSVKVGLQSHPVELPGYRWAGGCSTQGAAKRGGAPAFLKAHRAVVLTLDRARGLGLRIKVKDDGEFWTSRDPKVLLDKLEHWEGLVAALGRSRRDRPPTATTLAADIRPTLEARRRATKRLDRPVVEGLEG